MISILPRWMALLLLLVLSGCTHTSQPNNASQPLAWLAPGVRVQLPPPGISPTVHQQQLLTGRVDGKPQSLLVLLNADQEKISLAGLSSVGIRLFLLTYDRTGIHTEHTMILPKLPPASQVLADIMLSHWPIKTWKHRLPPGWRLDDVQDKRELRNDKGELVTEITYLMRKGKREPISVQQHVFKYHISIQYIDN